MNDIERTSDLIGKEYVCKCGERFFVEQGHTGSKRGHEMSRENERTLVYNALNKQESAMALSKIVRLLRNKLPAPNVVRAVHDLIDEGAIHLMTA